MKGEKRLKLEHFNRAGAVNFSMCDYACQSDSNLVARFLSVTGQLITPRVNRGVGGCNSDWDEIISEEDKFLLKLGFIKIIYLCTQPSTFLSLCNVKKTH